MRSTPTLYAISWALVLGCNTELQVAKDANVEPSATINEPTDGTVLTTSDAIELLGTVADGNGLADLTTVIWASSLDGVLSDPESSAPDTRGVTRATATLSEGVHAITLTATDTAGIEAVDAITVTVDLSDRAPEAEITSPASFSEFLLGEVIALSGGAYDPNQPPDTLTATWIAAPLDGASPDLTIGTDTPTPTGITTADWADATPGGWRITLEVADDDGEVATDDIEIEVLDPADFDADGDGWTPRQGDCDDDEPLVHPDRDEACDTLDNDCNNIVDDKDLDADAHIDLECTAYGGSLPVDDCDDENSTVYPGAAEQPDGIDNDCNGLDDDGLSPFDNDGDCYCAAVSCGGSINPKCATVEPGDCDDTDPLLNPTISTSTATAPATATATIPTPRCPRPTATATPSPPATATATTPTTR